MPRPQRNIRNCGASPAMFVTHLSAGDLSTINFYTPNDTRVKFFADLGLASPKAALDTAQSGTFSGSISAEKIDLFDDVDVFVTYGGLDLLEGARSQSAHGADAGRREGDPSWCAGANAAGTAANPTPLGISWC